MNSKSKLVGAVVAGALTLGFGFGTYAQEQNSPSPVTPNNVSPQTSQGSSVGQDKINTPANNPAIGSQGSSKQDTTQVKGKHKGKAKHSKKHAGRKGKGSRKHKTINVNATKPTTSENKQQASAAGSTEISDRLRVIDASK